MRPFGCLVTILNTLDPLGKFQGKVDEGFLVGYSVCSKAFIVFNSRTRIIQETLHVNFLENKPNVAGFQDNFDAKKAGEEVDQSYMLFPVWSTGSTNPQNNAEDAAFDGKEHDFDVKKPESKVILSPSCIAQSKEQDDKTKKEAKGKIPTIRQNSLNITNTFSAAGLSNTAVSPTYGKTSDIDTSQLPDDSDMPELKDIIYSDDEYVVGAEADFNNLESFIPCKKQTVVATSSTVAEYVAAASCCAQTNDVTRLQALVDKKKVVIMEDTIRDALRLDDAEGVDCLPNEEIFAELARIGYEKPSTKLTFYEAFFSSQ
nr:retrovirus-related Pol polyprotein from transposon TNT 1-94 [Tanacetum cinerariifolium]